jgi:putative cell wall-binding protein
MDEPVAAFRTWPMDASPYPYVWLDASGDPGCALSLWTGRHRFDIPPGSERMRAPAESRIVVGNGAPTARDMEDGEGRMRKPGWRTRSLGIVVALSLVCGLVPGMGVGMAAPVTDDESPRIMAPRSARIGAGDRYGTAAEIALAGWNRCDYVVIASGERFADGLVAGPLAHAYGAPILLTKPSSLPSLTAEAIVRTGAKKAIVVGSRSVVSDTVLGQLRVLGISTVERIGGADRYATSRLVAQRMATLGKVNAVVVAGGRGFADSLSIAGMAAYGGMPIILTTPDTLSPAADAAIKALAPADVVIVGGTRAVSARVAEALPNVIRVGGTDRYDTARLVAEYGFQTGYHDYSLTYIATGQGFADALALGPLAARKQACLVLSRPDGLPVATREFFEHHASSIDEILIFGSPSALSTSVHGEAVEAAETIIRSDVEVLGTEAVTGMQAALSANAAGNRVLLFDGAANGVGVIDQGDVIIHQGSTEATAFLLKVVNVQNTPGGDVSVEATQATLDEAIQKGSLDVRQTAPDAGNSALGLGGNAATLAFGPLTWHGEFSSLYVNNKPLKGLTLGADLTLSGSFVFNMAWGITGWQQHWWGPLPIWGVTHSGMDVMFREEVGIKLALDKTDGIEWDSEIDGFEALGGAADWQPDRKVYPPDPKPDELAFIGYVPIVWKVVRRDVYGLSVGRRVTGAIGFSQAATLTAGYQWDHDWGFKPYVGLDGSLKPIAEFDPSPNLQASVFFGQKLRLVIWETATPYVGAKIGASAGFAPTKDPWLWLDGGGTWMAGCDFSICQKVPLATAEIAGPLVEPEGHLGWTTKPFPDPTGWKWNTKWKWHIPLTGM